MTVSLTVAIATTGKRFPGLAKRQLPLVSGVRYHVFVQAPDLPPCPEALVRPDVTVSLTDGIGAARNRNAALATVDSPLLLFADDDLDFDASAIRALILRFGDLRDVDFLCARLADETGRPRKRYSEDGAPVRWWNCAKVGTPELALRPANFRRAGVWFDPAFGAGTSNHLGDEYIFLCDALRAGLRGKHASLLVARHPGESSGTDSAGQTMRIRKAVLVRALGRWRSWPARLGFALRHLKRFHGVRDFAFFLLP